jgi:hypothetical protein
MEFVLVGGVVCGMWYGSTDTEHDMTWPKNKEVSHNQAIHGLSRSRHCWWCADEDEKQEKAQDEKNR